MISLSRHRRWAVRSYVARALLVLVALAWLFSAGSRWAVHSHALVDQSVAQHALDHDHEHAPPVADEGGDDTVSHAHPAPGGSADVPVDAGAAWAPPRRLSWQPPSVTAAHPTAEQPPPHRPPIA